MNYLFLENIVVYGSHGVYAEEGRLGNAFIINIKLFGDFSKAMLSDDINDTVDYCWVFECIRKEAAEPVYLLERLAYKIIESLKLNSSIKGVELNIRKKAPSVNGEVEHSGFCLKEMF